jgi:hypothetical protein
MRDLVFPAMVFAVCVAVGLWLGFELGRVVDLVVPSAPRAGSGRTV